MAPCPRARGREATDDDDGRTDERTKDDGVDDDGVDDDARARARRTREGRARRDDARGERGANEDEDEDDDARAEMGPELKANIDAFIAENKVVLFMKGTKEAPRCGFSNTCVQILQSMNAPVRRRGHFVQRGFETGNEGLLELADVSAVVHRRGIFRWVRHHRGRVQGWIAQGGVGTRYVGVSGRRRAPSNEN